MISIVDPEGLTFGDAARQRAARTPNAVACRKGDRLLTFEALDLQANRLANGLIRAGLQPGDRVALLMPAEPAFLVAIVGVARTGGVVEILMPQYGGAELVRMLRAAPPRWLIAARAHQVEMEAIAAAYQPQTVGLEDDAPAALRWEALLAEGAPEPPAVRVSPEDDAVVIFTSGTTGSPKAVLRSHQSAMSHAMLANHALAFDDESSMPHTQFRYDDAAQVLASGGCYVLVESFQPREVLATIERERITHIGTAPPLLQLWLSSPDWTEFDLSSLRGVFVGAMPAASELYQGVFERTGLPLVRMYGAIETGLLTANDTPPGEKFSALGRVVPGKELLVVDERGEPAPVGTVGELLARPLDPRGLGFLRGYLGEAEPRYFEGWWRTGDLVYRDAEDYYFLVGRAYEVVNVAGRKVFCPDVERVLLDHPAVAEAAVIGLPDAKRGEIVLACILLRPDRQATIPELRAHCARHLAPHQVPRRLVIETHLPRTATGKINKQALRRRFGGPDS